MNSEQETSEEEEMGLGAACCGCLIIGLAVFYVFDVLEYYQADSARVPWYLALLYMLGGKKVAAGVLWALGLLAFWLWCSKGVITFLLSGAVIVVLVLALVYSDKYSYGVLIEKISISNWLGLIL